MKIDVSVGEDTNIFNKCALVAEFLNEYEMKDIIVGNDSLAILTLKKGEKALKGKNMKTSYHV